MSFTYRISLAFVLWAILFESCGAQRPSAPLFQRAGPKRLSTFPWMDGKWKPDSPDIVAFRARVHALFSEDRLPEKEVDSLYVRLISRYRKDKKPEDLCKILILDSYFIGRYYRHGFDIVEETTTVPGLDTYEYARAAWCVLGYQQCEIVKWSLYPTLIKRDPKDVSVLLTASMMWGHKFPGEPPVEFLLKTAEFFLNNYPQRDEFLLGPAMFTYATYYVRQEDRPIGLLRKIVALGRKRLAHPQVSDGAKKMTQTFLKKYEDELKRRGG